MGERMSLDEIEAPSGFGHQIRYRLASGFVSSNDIVVDAACGIGYGRKYLPQNIDYHGVDKLPVNERIAGYSDGWEVVDLTIWQPDYEFDVAISFETIEHLDDYQNLLTQLKRAKKWVVCSVPTIPTVHMNPYHKHDFEPLDLVNIFEDEKWSLYHYLAQPLEFSHIYVFGRN